MPRLIPADGDAIVFMKVGRHAGETLDEIVARKMKEHEDAKEIFWGYGGGTMHPLSKVQPFMRSHVRNRDRVFFVMEAMDSNHPDSELFANQFSADGTNWSDVPEGIRVRGSRYALVLNEIEVGDLDVNLADYRVGIGPSEGRIASEYIRGRVDKGLFSYGGRSNQDAGKSVKHISLVATLREPYAVLLSNEPKGKLSPS